MNAIKMSRHAKGKRPVFFPDEPAADRLMTMLMALVTEVAVMRERLDTVESLAAAMAAIATVGRPTNLNNRLSEGR